MDARCGQQAQSLAAASEAKRRAQVAEAASAPVESLRPLANPSTPIPLPENANDVKFDGNDGNLDFTTSPSTPKSVANLLPRCPEAAWLEGGARSDQRADDVLDGFHQGCAEARHDG